MSFKYPQFSKGAAGTQADTSTIGRSGDTLIDHTLNKITLVKKGSDTVTYAGNVFGVFGGGNPVTNTIDYINIATLGNAQSFGQRTTAQTESSATSNGTTGRGVFGGGHPGTGVPVNTIDYITITTPGNASTFGQLTSARYGIASTSNGSTDRGVFGGGYNSGGTPVSTLDYITISVSGNATSFGTLTVTKANPAATSNGTNNRGVFGGGYSSSGTSNIIDYITIGTLGNATSFGQLTVARYSLAATSNGTNNRGVFGGGYNSGSGYLTVMDYITISTLGNATSNGNLSLARANVSATSNGTSDRGVFGGGVPSGGTYTNTIDYIAIGTVTTNATAFGQLTSARGGLAATSNA